jgi:hypothetical protein
LVSLSQYCSLSTLTKLFVEILKFSKIIFFQKKLSRKIENILNNCSDKTFRGIGILKKIHNFSYDHP